MKRLRHEWPGAWLLLGWDLDLWVFLVSLSWDWGAVCMAMRSLALRIGMFQDTPVATGLYTLD